MLCLKNRYHFLVSAYLLGRLFAVSFFVTQFLPVYEDVILSSFVVFLQDLNDLLALFKLILADLYVLLQICDGLFAGVEFGLRLYYLPQRICQLYLLALQVVFQLPILLLKCPHFLADFVVSVGHHINLIVAFLQLVVVVFLVALLRSDLFLQ